MSTRAAAADDDGAGYREPPAPGPEAQQAEAPKNPKKPRTLH